MTLHPPTRTEQVALALLNDMIDPWSIDVLENHRREKTPPWGLALERAELAVAAYESAHGIAHRRDVVRLLRRIIDAYTTKRWSALERLVETARGRVG